MKRKLLSVMLTVLFVCGSAVCFAQSKKAATTTSKRLFTVLGVREKNENLAISTELLETPRFLIDGVNIEHSKQERRNAKGWLSVVIPFKVNTPKDISWLENVRIRVDIALPVINDKQQMEWGILTGAADLAPIAVSPDSPYHLMRMFVSPYIVSRYFPLRSDRKKLERLIYELPVRVTFEYNNNKFFGGRPAGKEFAKIASALVPNARIGTSEDGSAAMFTAFDNNPRSFFVLENSLISADKTPWAWYEYDKFETTVERQGR